MCMISIEDLKQFASGRNILLVEDNEINAGIARAQLEPAGFNVAWVDDGSKACEMFMNSSPHYYSAIVTDLMMPVMDGMEAAKVIRNSDRADSNIPILGITANAFSNKDSLSSESVINSVISKPYKREELLDWIYSSVMEYEKTDVTGYKG